MLLFCHRTAYAIRLLNLLLYAAVSVLDEHNATCVSANLHAVYGVASHLSSVLRSLSLVDASREVDSYVVGRSRNHLLVVVHSLSVHAVSVSVVSLRLSELSEGVACLLLLNLLRVVEECINAVATLQVLGYLDLVDDERIVVLASECDSVAQLTRCEVERECAPVVGVELTLLSLACVLAVDDERLVLEHRACLHLHLIASAVVVKCKLWSNEFAADVVVGHAGANEAALSVSAPVALPSVVVYHIQAHLLVLAVLESVRLVDSYPRARNLREILVDHHVARCVSRSRV